MSQSTEQRVPASPVDAAVDAFLAPVAEHLSAMTAARAMGRFLAYHPEYATNPDLGWAPHFDGRLSVNGALLHQDTCALMHGVAAALGLVLDVRPSASEKYGPVVTLRTNGFYDGAEWHLWAMVSATQFAQYQGFAQQAAA